MQLACGLLVLACASHGAQRGITAEDYFAFETISDAHISPDGKQVAYTVTTIDKAKNRRDSSIWVVAVDGRTAARRLSAEGVNSNSARWSPDGARLAFVSTRSTGAAAGADDAPRPQIWTLTFAGGEAQVLTHLKNGAGAYQWSPDGKRLVVVSRSGPSDNVKAADRKSDVRHYTHISYKFNDTGWYDDKRSHLWVVDAVKGEAKQITQGEDWNDADPQWSPDSTRIAFVSDRTGKEYDGGENKDVWTIAADGGPLTKISDHEYADTMPRWSPDGKQIVFAGQTERRQFPRLYVAPAAGGKSTLASEDTDLIPTGLEWGPGARELRFETGYRGTTQVFRVDLDSRKFAAVTSGERGIHGFDTNDAAGIMTYLANDFQHLDDLYVTDLAGKNERQLTHLNAALWKDVQTASVERLKYKSTDGWDIDGFFVKPVGWEAGKKYPLILSVHGGPAGQYGVDWYHEFQVYAAKGWAVFFCNPRGSTGYGQKFERGIVNNWGGMDYQDVMAGVDAAIKQYPWIDTERMGVTGGSYGGFMTNWIVGHTTRFKAAVTLRSVSNFISDDGTRDGAYGHADDFQGFLFDYFDQYWSASPLKYVKNVKTPTLVLHSDNDYRVPLEQGEQWFRALKHYGVNAELVIFPRENHNLTRTGEPKHLVESLNWQCWWFDRFLEGKSDAKAPDSN